MEASIYGYLRHHASELGARIIEMHPPLQSTSDDTRQSSELFCESRYRRRQSLSVDSRNI